MPDNLKSGIGVKESKLKNFGHGLFTLLKNVSLICYIEDIRSIATYGRNGDDVLIENKTENSITSPAYKGPISFGDAHGHGTTYWENQIKIAIKNGDPKSKIDRLEKYLAESIAGDAMDDAKKMIR